MAWDVIIQNGTILDGTGAPAFEGDIAIQNGAISEVRRRRLGAEPLPADAPRVIDAGGRHVTPGFVDVHSHSDMHILADPVGPSKLFQGITTEIVGNCGFSAFPLRREVREQEEEAHRRFGLDLDWNDAAGYFDRIDSARPSFNVATFVGHGNVRGSVMGFEDRAPIASEMAQMVADVTEAVDQGCLGLTTGLIYSPGIFADTSEVVVLQTAAKERGGMYASHVRGEGDTLLEAADEFMAVVKGADCQGQFSHLKASGPRNWGKVEKVIGQIEAINRSGGHVCFDKYPYVASSTGLSSLLPRWVRDGGRDAAVARLRDPALQERIVRESAEINEGRDGWDSVLICEAGAPDFEKFQGQSIGETARALGSDAGTVFLELLIQSKLGTAISNFTMSQDETDRVITHPLGMVCTDASCRATSGVLRYDSPHPRAYGTFARYFRDYVRERKLLTREEAVRKVTSYPCDTFGFARRGRIAPGMAADVLVVDLDNFRDLSDFADPHHYCEGLDTIIVNGVITVERGRLTGERGGRSLRRGWN